MRKRGQVALFVVIGIIVVVTIVLFLALRSETVKKAVEKGIIGTEAFSDTVRQVKGIVQDCLDKELKDTFQVMSVGPVGDYKQDMGNEVKDRVQNCVNFSNIPAEVSAGQIESVDITFSGKTRIAANMRFNVLITQDDNRERLREFRSDISITPQCCVPVKVDKDCYAEENLKTINCGIVYDIKEGESLKKGGKCNAC